MIGLSVLRRAYSEWHVQKAARDYAHDRYHDWYGTACGEGCPYA